MARRRTLLTVLLLGSALGLLSACGDTSRSQDQRSDAGTWAVVATDAGAREIEAIKGVREVTGLGLKDAKDLVDGTPSVIQEGLSLGQAREVADRLEQAGMTVELRGP